MSSPGGANWSGWLAPGVPRCPFVHHRRHYLVPWVQGVLTRFHDPLHEWEQQATPLGILPLLLTLLLVQQSA